MTDSRTTPRGPGDWYRLAAGAFRSMLRVGLTASGVALMGLAFASLLLEMDWVAGGPELTVMEALGAIVGVGGVGGALLGLGAEATYGAAALEEDSDVWRRAGGRVIAGLVVSVALLALGALVPLPDGLPLTVDYGRATLRAAGVAGMVSCSLLPPLAALLSVRTSLWKPRWDPYLLFGVWTVLMMALFSPPA